MKHTAEQKLTTKRQLWLERTGLALGMDAAATRELLHTVRRQSIRLNPLIAPPQETLALLQQAGWAGKPYEWAEDCYTIEEGMEAVRDSAVVAAGAAFIQNAASWLPVLALQAQPGERILDVCAAPGGKSSHIAALTGNEVQLWVNDNSRSRLLRMQDNLRRLGVAVERASLYDATHLARKLDGEQFDKILLDAPCSGEGLMQFDRDKDFATWSVAHIQRLQQLQKRIISQVWQLLKPNGTLVYSTCTMAPEENEAVVDYLLRSRQDATVEPYMCDLSNSKSPVLQWNGKTYSPALEGCLRLAPSQDVEAFFVCRLKKVAASDSYVV